MMSTSDGLSGLGLSNIPYSPPPPGKVSNFVMPETLTGTTTIVTVVLLSLALTFLLARLYTTIAVTRSIGTDDLTIIIAYIFGATTTALTLSSSALARHSWNFALSMYTPKLAKIIYAEQMTIPVALFLSKLSILILFHRIFSVQKPFRYANYLGMFWALLIAIASIILDAVYCTPGHMQSFNTPEVALRCNEIEYPILIRGAFGVALDFYILLLPLPSLWNLHSNLRRKLELTIIFMTGSLACTASVLGLFFQIELFQGNDKIWNGYKVEIAAVAETNVAIMVACMPACATLFKHASQNIPISSSIEEWFSRLRHSSDRNSPRSEEDEMNGNKSVACTVMRSHGGLWRLKRSQPHGNPKVAIGSDMGDLAISSSGDATMSGSRGSLDFYHASFDPVHHASSQREGV